MDSIHAEYIRADKVLADFSNKEPKFASRFEATFKNMEDFIKANDIGGKVSINELCLGYALLDYFEDVRRLKEFHQVEHINCIKIVSYMAYWLLKRKPLQVSENDKILVYINEKFVLAYILEFLNTEGEVPIIMRDNKGITSFLETLLYFLKYRVNSAAVIELAITSFFAGQIYENREEDISSKLSKYE